MILAPYGGGALVTGIASVAKALKPSIDVFACEIETGAPLAAAFANNQITEVPYTKSWVDNLIVVTLKETARALKLLIERNHLICEGASATTIAAGLWHYKTLVDQGKAGRRRENNPSKPIKIVAVLSGAGIDSETIIKCLRNEL